MKSFAFKDTKRPFLGLTPALMKVYFLEFSKVPEVKR